MTEDDHRQLLNWRDYWYRTGAMSMWALEEFDRWLGVDTYEHRLTDCTHIQQNARESRTESVSRDFEGGPVGTGGLSQNAAREGESG